MTPIEYLQPMLTSCQMNHKEHVAVKFQSKQNISPLRIYIYKLLLEHSIAFQNIKIREC